MATFKVGDAVRVRDEGESSKYRTRRGQVGTVSEVRETAGFYPYLVRFGSDELSLYAADELEPATTRVDAGR